MFPTAVGGLELEPKRLRQNLHHLACEIQRQQQTLLLERLEPMMTPRGDKKTATRADAAAAPATRTDKQAPIPPSAMSSNRVLCRRFHPRYTAMMRSTETTTPDRAPADPEPNQIPRQR